jgi:hypothetical protein
MELTDKVSITLEAQMWNGVIDALHNAPYRQAAPVIAEIMRQVQEVELKAARAAIPAREMAAGEEAAVPAATNGAAHAGT